MPAALLKFRVTLVTLAKRPFVLHAKGCSASLTQLVGIMDFHVYQHGAVSLY